MPRRPGPVALRAAILTRYLYALPTYLPGQAPPSPAAILRAARRWAAEDRARGYRILSAVAPQEKRPRARSVP